MKTKEKRYEVEVDLKFTEITYATSKAQAVKQVKQSFKDEYNLDITDEEIINVNL